MKALITADLHFHAFQEFAKEVREPESGLPINSRLLDQLTTFRQMVSRAVAKGASRLIIAGDLFHKRGIIPVDVYQFVYAALKWAKKQGLEIVILSGNHDQMDYDGAIHSIYGLQDLATIIDSPCMLTMWGHLISFLPFTTNLSDVKSHLYGTSCILPQADILIAHLGVEGAEVGCVEYRIKDPIKLEDLDPTRYKWVVLGHYHKPQLLAPNVLYVGSPWQIDRGESGDVKRFLLLDFNTMKMVSMKTHAKEFVATTASDLLATAAFGKPLVGAYYDIMMNDPEISAEAVLSVAPGSKLIPVTKIKGKKARIAVSEDMSDKAILKAYLKHKVTEVDPTTLLDRGMALLSKIPGGDITGNNLEFTRVVAENFMSIGQADLKLNRAGSVVAVIGKNNSSEGFKSNGSGKSSLLPESLNWCLFGETARDLPADKVVNNIRKRDCRVTVYLRIGGDKLSVTRYRKHKKLGGSGLKLVKNGENITLGTTPLTEARLANILGLDFTTFSSVVAFSPDTLRFVSQTDSLQKSTLDSILQTRRFSLALEQAKDAIKTVRKDTSELRLKRAAAESSHAAAVTQLDTYNVLNNEFAKREKQRVADLKLEMETAEAELATLQELHSNADEKLDNANLSLTMAKDNIPEVDDAQVRKVAVELGKVQGSLKSLRDNMASIQRKLDKANAMVGQPCEVCGQKITNTGHLIVTHQNDRRILMDSERKLVEQEVSLREQESSLNKTVEARDKAEDSVDYWKDEVARFQKSVNSYDLQMRQQTAIITRVKKQIAAVPQNDYPQLIHDTKMTISMTTHEMADLDQVIYHSEVEEAELQFWVDGFGNSGIRSYLLDQVIPDLTEYANGFARKLTGGSIEIEFQTYSEGAARDKFQVKAWNNEGSDIYAGNSSGEKRRIDVCVMLALFRVAYSRTKLNILLLDEALDTLDEPGLDNVVGLLEGLARELDMTIYVTSHTDLNTRLHECIVIEKNQHGIATLR